MDGLFKNIPLFTQIGELWLLCLLFLALNILFTFKTVKFHHVIDSFRTYEMAMDINGSKKGKTIVLTSVNEEIELEGQSFGIIVLVMSYCCWAWKHFEKEIENDVEQIVSAEELIEKYEELVVVAYFISELSNAFPSLFVVVVLPLHIFSDLSS